MKRKLLWIALILLVIIGILGVGPFLIPVSPLKGTVPPEALADADSRFVEIDGVRVHYKTMGQGEPALILLHGFAASTFTWREVMSDLAADHTVVAFDRPAFGLTERLLPGEWEGDGPYTPEAQTDITIGLMDELGIEKAVLVGNSAGGTVAAHTALRYPERVQALVLVDPAIYAGGGSPSWIKPLLGLPQIQRLGPLVARNLLGRSDQLLDLAWYDASNASPDVIEGYRKYTRITDWDKALWAFTQSSRDIDLPSRLAELTLPALVITGDSDRIVPTEQSVRLADELPNADLVVIPQCGHVPQEECPEAFMDATMPFLDGLR